jgi:hypothetical protein
MSCVVLAEEVCFIEVPQHGGAAWADAVIGGAQVASMCYASYCSPSTEMLCLAFVAAALAGCRVWNHPVALSVALSLEVVRSCAFYVFSTRKCKSVSASTLFLSLPVCLLMVMKTWRDLQIRCVTLVVYVGGMALSAVACEMHTATVGVFMVGAQCAAITFNHPVGPVFFTFGAVSTAAWARSENAAEPPPSSPQRCVELEADGDGPSQS